MASDARALKFLPVALAIAAVSAAGALATSSHATPPTLDRQTYTRELHKLAESVSGAVVAIVVTPAATWKGAAGWADFQAKRRADPDDRFAIESTTKTFVATVVLQLVGERRLPAILQASPGATAASAATGSTSRSLATDSRPSSGQ